MLPKAAGSVLRSCVFLEGRSSQTLLRQPCVFHGSDLSARYLDGWKPGSQRGMLPIQSPMQNSPPGFHTHSITVPLSRRETWKLCSTDLHSIESYSNSGRCMRLAERSENYSANLTQIEAHSRIGHAKRYMYGIRDQASLKYSFNAPYRRSSAKMGRWYSTGSTFRGYRISAYGVLGGRVR